MKYSKKISVGKADDLMSDLFKNIKERYGINAVDFGLLPSSVNGATNTKRYSFHVLEVRIDYFSGQKLKYDGAGNPLPATLADILAKKVKFIDTVSFLSTVYTCKHEERHVQQFHAIEEGVVCDGLTKKDMSVIACEKLAIADNRMYYHQGNKNVRYDNAQHMLTELDAQKFATKSLYEYCKDLYDGDEKLAKNLVTEVVKNEYKSRGDIISSCRYYIPIDDVNTLTYEDIMKLYDEEIDKIRDGANLREYISYGDFMGTTQYEYEKNIKDKSEPMPIDDFCDEVTIYDQTFRWLTTRLDLTKFEMHRFADYFETSHDVDKFVIATSNIMLNEEGEGEILKDVFEKTKCLVDESMIWDDATLLSVLENKRPYRSFNFDKYKMKQDLECRLQAVQDSAEEKGLVSDEEIDVEREVKLW